MKSRVSGGRPVAWEDAGRQIAPILGSHASAVVVSSDPVAAAHVALGIARAEANHRRVVIGDLVGDLPPLRSLTGEEDPHGISDSFLYGVSPNKIEHEVVGSANLFIMPSGSEPDIGEEIVANPRWKRIASGFEESGALLLLVARSDAPGLVELVDQLDGVVLVKDPELRSVPSALVLARVAKPTPTLKLPLRLSGTRIKSVPLRRWLYPALAAAVLLIAALGLASMLRGRVESPQSTQRTAAKPVTLPTRMAAKPTILPAPPAQPVGESTPEAKRVASKSVPVRASKPAAVPVVPPSRAPAETTYMAFPANVNDSSSASLFTVELLVANTAEGANLFVQKNGGALPAAAVSPVPIGRDTWYKVTAGAYTRRDQADSLLSVLRKSRVLVNDSAGSVAQAPLALLVDSVPMQGGMGEAVRAAIQKYVASGLPVYALMQNDGSARLYAGAFVRADHSAELLKILRSAGLKPVLVYRTGRER